MTFILPFVRIGAMSYNPILWNEGKDLLVADGLIKSLTKGKGKKNKSQYAKEKAKVHKGRVRQERNGKSSPQDMVSGRMGTPKSRKTSLRMKKVKKGTSVLNTSSKRHFDRTVFWNAKQDHLLLIEFQNFNEQLPLFSKLFPLEQGARILENILKLKNLPY